MVKLPANVVRLAGTNAPDGKCSAQDLRRYFTFFGYGKNSAEKWIRYYVSEQVLTEVGKNEEGQAVYTCVWWSLPTTESGRAIVL